MVEGECMENKHYVQALDDKDKVKIIFAQNHGKIIKFVVQYYALVGRRWRTVMRIDNCHGFAHQHVYHLRGKGYKLSLNKDTNIAFTEAQGYIKKNFVKIKENFLFN